jgi:two-component system torCAD operon response regulator TorR
MLTGKNEPVDTIVGLEVGADDYMTKPFDNRELLARIRSVLRRTKDTRAAVSIDAQQGETGVFKFDGWEMNLEAYELNMPGGEAAPIGNHEFRLLAILVQNAGHALSRDQILQNLSRRGWQPDDRSVDVSVGKLRKVLEKDPAQPKLIRTIRGVGYQFTGKVESA